MPPSALAAYSLAFVAFALAHRAWTALRAASRRTALVFRLHRISAAARADAWRCLGRQLVAPPTSAEGCCPQPHSRVSSDNRTLSTARTYRQLRQHARRAGVRHPPWGDFVLFGQSYGGVSTSDKGNPKKYGDSAPALGLRCGAGVGLGNRRVRGPRQCHRPAECALRGVNYSPMHHGGSFDTILVWKLDRTFPVGRAHGEHGRGIACGGGVWGSGRTLSRGSIRAAPSPVGDLMLNITREFRAVREGPHGPPSASSAAARTAPSRQGKHVGRPHNERRIGAQPKTLLAHEPSELPRES